MGNNTTSLPALLRAKPEHVTTAHRILTSLLYKGPATRLDLANRLDKPINAITDPVLRLMKGGKIEQHSQIIQPETGCKVWCLRLTKP